MPLETDGERARCGRQTVNGRDAAVGGSRADAQWWTVGGSQFRVRLILRTLRAVIGAPDYDRYLEHHAQCHAGSSPLDRKAFYAAFLSWRYEAGPNRCC